MGEEQGYIYIAFVQNDGRAITTILIMDRIVNGDCKTCTVKRGSTKTDLPDLCWTKNGKSPECEDAATNKWRLDTID